jgi:hypothetical protein
LHPFLARSRWQTWCNNCCSSTQMRLSSSSHLSQQKCPLTCVRASRHAMPCMCQPS